MTKKSFVLATVFFPTLLFVIIGYFKKETPVTPLAPVGKAPVKRPAFDKIRSQKYDLAMTRAEALDNLAHKYVELNKGYLPLAHKWEDALRPLCSKKEYPFQDFSQLVKSSLGKNRRFAMNSALSRVRLFEDATGDEYNKLILFYETTKIAKNSHGNLKEVLPLAKSGEMILGTVGNGGEGLVLNSTYAFSANTYRSIPIEQLASRIDDSIKTEQEILRRKKLKLPKPPL